MKHFVVAYRTHIHSRLEKWKVYQVLDRSKMLQWYRTNPRPERLAMRKKFVYFVLIPAVVIILAVVLFIDTWVTMGLEAGGEAAVGAKVEIEGLHVSLSPLGIRWARLQVADPHDGWRNLFETRNVRFAMDFGQLLRAKYIIQAMEVDELILGTKRTTDGSLPHKAAATAAAGTGDNSFTARAQGALQSYR